MTVDEMVKYCLDESMSHGASSEMEAIAAKLRAAEELAEAVSSWDMNTSKQAKRVLRIRSALDAYEKAGEG